VGRIFSSKGGKDQEKGGPEVEGEKDNFLQNWIGKEVVIRKITPYWGIRGGWKKDV